MLLGIIGRGWGNVYARTLHQMEVPYWQATRDWHTNCDGVIIASPSDTHYDIARRFLGWGIPVLIEKPVTLKGAEARDLVSMGGIAFAGHTRLYSPAWRDFKSRLPKVEKVVAIAGGTDKDPWWDWGPHLVAMSFDLGCEKPEIQVSQDIHPLTVIVNGEHTFTDVETDPSPLKVLLGEFIAAIEKKQPNNAGLQLGARVVEYLEGQCRSRISPP